MSLQWRPEMAIDRGIIDHDHQVLISIINDFIELKPHVGGTAELQRTVARLYHYANTHFSREEALQRAARYPTIAEHEQLHRQLNEKLDIISQQLVELDRKPVQIISSLSSDDDIAVIDSDYAEHLITTHNKLSHLLRTWMLNHILKFDLPMRDYVAAMRPFAAQMPSLWRVQPAQLAPFIDSPDAAKHALANAKGWMSARFHNERKPLNALQRAVTPPADPNEHPAITRMRREAQALGMTAEFDACCAMFNSNALSQAFQLISQAQPGRTGINRIDLLPSTARPFLRQAALFQRTVDPQGRHRYQATHVGSKFSRIFGDIGNGPLDVAKPPQKFARWKMLIDGVLDFDAPLRVISIAEAFGRDDLTIERLLVPFRSPDRLRDDVMIVASYDVALD